MILLCLDAHEATLRRYECAEGVKVLTHQYFHETKPCAFTQAVVDEMRYMPPDAYKVAPPPRPTNPPAAAGVAYEVAA